MQRGNLVARMIVGICQLRLSIQQLRFGRWSLIDSRKEIDDVLSRSARRGEMNHHIAMAVEAAYVAHVRVVIGRNIDVVVFSPPDTFQMNRDWGSDGSGNRTH